MRTSITLARTGAGWLLLAGPDVPAEIQRRRFAEVAEEWPDGIIEIRYQPNDGRAKTLLRNKAETVASRTLAAVVRTEEKAQARRVLLEILDDATRAPVEAPAPPAPAKVAQADAPPTKPKL